MINCDRLSSLERDLWIFSAFKILELLLNVFTYLTQKLLERRN